MHLKTACRVLLGVFFIAAGANHFRQPAFYASIVPPFFPSAGLLVVLSGLAEIALGAAVLVPSSRVWAAWGLIALLVAVFPANLYMAWHPERFPAIAPALLWLRLPLQGVFIAWAYWFT